MIVGVFGNCQAGVIAQAIPRVFDGVEARYISNNERSGGFSGPQSVLESLHDVDVILFQPLSEQYAAVSESAIRQNYVSKTVLSFPYIFNSGFTTLGYAPMAKKNSYGEIYGEQAVVARRSAGATPAGILSDIENGDTLDADRRFTESMTELRRREDNIDIKIADFIEERLHDDFLFITHNHPTNVLFAELLRQIAQCLAIKHDPGRLHAMALEDNGLPDTGAPYTPGDVRRMRLSCGWHSDWKPKIAHLLRLIESSRNGLRPRPAVLARIRLPDRGGAG